MRRRRERDGPPHRRRFRRRKSYGERSKPRSVSRTEGEQRMPEVEMTIHIEGLDTLDAALRDLPTIVQEQLMRESLDAGSAVIRRSVADRIHRRTGKTSDTITTE